MKIKCGKDKHRGEGRNGPFLLPSHSSAKPASQHIDRQTDQCDDLGASTNRTPTVVATPFPPFQLQKGLQQCPITAAIPITPGNLGRNAWGGKRELQSIPCRYRRPAQPPREALSKHENIIESWVFGTDFCDIDSGSQHGDLCKRNRANGETCQDLQYVSWSRVP